MSNEHINTILDLPISPEEIGVLLPPSALRRIDFSALDFEALRRASIEYVKTYYPEDFNDFVLSNGFIMFTEIVSAIGNILSERSDIIADEAFLPTAQTRTAVAQHLELIGQELRRATSAVVEVECSVTVPVSIDIQIPAGLTFSVIAPDGSTATYELFRTPGDYSSNIIIPRLKRGVIAFAVEGKFGSSITEVSTGEPNQYVDILSDNVLSEPIKVVISSGDINVIWEQIEFLELGSANSEVYEVQFLDDRARIKFGDGATGKIPIAGQVITIDYRIGGGVKGRIGQGAINETRPISQVGFATQNILFRNLNPSRGGQDKESLSNAKKRAPSTFATHNNAATSEDYTNIAENFEHPVYGKIQKAVAVIRSGIDKDVITVVNNIRNADTVEEATQYLLGNYVNRNIVEIYALQEDEDTPIAPNFGLKKSLKTALSDVNVFTDELRILDGSIRLINLDLTITVSKNIDASVVKERVDFAIQQVFDINNIRMGQGFFRSDLITTIQNIDGVKTVDIFGPVDDFPSLRRVVDSSLSDDEKPQGVGVNEIYVLGSQNIEFYLEQGNLNTPN